MFLSNKKNVDLQKVLSEELHLMSDLNSVKDKSEVIFDANNMSYKNIINLISSRPLDKSLTFKILPNKSNFILGSDNTISRGEVIFFN